MAEIFKNFMAKTNNNVEKVIVPSGTINNNKSNIADDTSFGENFREEDSTVQVHSLYISQAFEPTRVQGDNRFNPDNFRNFDLYILDENRPALKIYVAHDVQLVPGCPYYIEKNITLTPSQKLCMILPNVAPNTNGGLNVHVVASAIIFTDDIEE
jgi:hypothetical protein